MSGQRARRGDGSVFRDAQRGVWVAVVELGRDSDTGRRIRRKASAHTKTEARALLDDMRAERRKAGTVGKRDLTVGQVLADYLAHPPPAQRSEITRRLSRDHAAKITAALGKTRLAKLKPSDVERFLATMTATHSTSTIRQTRALLRAAIRRVERDHLVSHNAADLAQVPDGERHRDARWFTLEQVGKLTATAADDPWWHAYVRVAITLGLRPGELLGLSWADVDLDAGTVAVQRSLKAEGLADLKTRQSRRTLDLPAATAAALREHKRAQAERRIALGPAWHDHGLVFPGADGSPCSRSAAGHGFARLCERAGLGPGWTRYACRHTWVSVLSHSGVDIEVIADAAGHINSNVTRTVYRHGLADQISAAALVWDALEAPQAPKLGSQGGPGSG